LKQFILIAFMAIVGSCGTAKKITQLNPPTSLKLIDVYTIPHDFRFKETTVGGLSGIDYDAGSNSFYTISDDRSERQPARYYRINIAYSEKRIDTVIFQEAINLLQPNGKTYPAVKENPSLTPDPESIRYNPKAKELVWTSEGERLINAKDSIIQDPAIHFIHPSGKHIRTFGLPSGLQMQKTENGPRRNGVLEGASFSPDYKKLYVSLEEPRHEDGPQAALVTNDAWVRIYSFDTRKGKNEAQYAYKLDPVAYAPNPAGSFMVNGIPDILSAGDNKLLVMERSFSTGRLACTIKIFLVDLNEAQDIKEIASLKQQPPVKPLQKKLLLNLDELGIYTDNVEGMSFGPTLPNGKRTLWMIADNNFSPLEKTQLFLFEVNE
jgi:hypothetical protein